MPTIWEDEYLQNHTKTQLNKLLDKYEDANWQCPRCDEVNPVYSRDRVIRGWDDFGTQYTYNKWCYECNYIRPTGTAYNLGNKKPRKKRLTGTWTEKWDLAYRDGSYGGKWYTIELYERHKTVLVYWGKETNRDTSGAFKEFKFDTKAEARTYFEKKLREKLDKGYFDLFPSYHNEKPKKAAAKKSTRKPVKRKTVGKKSSKPKAKKSNRKSTKTTPKKTRAKSKVLTKKK